MKLSRLIVIILTLTFSLVFSVALTVVVSNSRDYLATQMRTHAQDTATALGLSLTTSLKDADIATTNAMVDAIFDRGYYKAIVIRGIDGAIMVERHLALQQDKTPRWFSDLIPLDAPRGESLVMQGWKQLATVEIDSHPGHAYRALWQVTHQAFWWIMGIAVVAFGMILTVLKAALKPLSEMETIALDICKRQFRTLNKTPWARELKRVAAAINLMSTTLERMLHEQTTLAENMYTKAYRDGVTGLTNGRSFRERFEHLLNTPGEFPGGALFIAHLANFKEYNQAYGHAAGDALLRNAANTLLSICNSYEASIVARLNGAEFAILVPHASQQQTLALASQLTNAMTTMQNISVTPTPVHIGIVLHRSNMNASAMLAAADMALNAAQNGNTSGYNLYHDDGENEIDAQWKSMIVSSLKEGNIFLEYQPVHSCVDRTEIYREALVRIEHSNLAAQPAGAFISIAKQLGLTTVLDKLVIQHVVQTLSRDPNTGLIAVNIFSSSLLDNEFVAWLFNTISNNPTTISRIVIEIQEPCLSDYFSVLRNTLERIRASGVAIAIDHFGHNAATISRLNEFRIDYIKLDGSYSRDINSNDSSQFFVKTMVGIAHGIGIKVIAEFVETAEEMEALKALGVDGVQGFHICRPC